MDSNTIFISLIYYVGIVSCAVQGAEKGKYENSIPILYYIANAFGGGFMRDVIFLGVHPWLLTASALPDIVLVIIGGFLYTYYFFICKAGKKHYDIAMRLVAITDAFGLGSFICIGMDKAFIYSNNALTIVICGYVTAIGGGILASGKPLTKIFKTREMVRYHLVTLIGCLYYYIFRHSLCLIYVIVIGLFLANTDNLDYRTLNNSYPCNLITLYLDVFLLYPAICNNNNNFQKQKIIKNAKKLSICPECPKLYLVQHRIRQC